jgi:hypothetical protein
LPETLYGRRKMTAWLDCSGFAGVSEHTVDRAVLLTLIRVKGLVSGVQHHRVDRPLADAVNVKQKLLIGTGETYPEVGLVDRSAWSLDGTGCQQHRTHNYLSGVPVRLRRLEDSRFDALNQVGHVSEHHPLDLAPGDPGPDVLDVGPGPGPGVVRTAKS